MTTRPGAGRVWLPLLLLLALPLAARPSAPAASEEEAHRLEALRGRIAALSASLETDRDRQDALQRELASSERAIDRILRELRALDEERRGHRATLADLEARRARERAALAEHRGALGRQVRAAYAVGRQGHLKLLLNQEDPARVGRSLAYYGYLNRARARRIESIELALAELRRIRAAVDDELAALEGLRARELRRKQALQEGRAARRALLERLAADMAGKRERLERLRADAQRLEALLHGVYRALADIPDHALDRRPLPALKGELPWPVQGPIRTAFGQRPGRARQPIEGVVIGAQPGREVRSIARGRVAYADWLRGFGLLLIVDHGGGYLSLYGYNEGLLKDVGEWVEGGEPVATTGGQPRAGLYFAIRSEGRAVDPIAWCRPRG